MATSHKIVVANTRFSVALATSWSQFRTLYQRHFLFCFVFVVAVALLWLFCSVFLLVYVSKGVLICSVN